MSESSPQDAAAIEEEQPKNRQQVLRLVDPMAALVLATVIIGRAIVPQLRGLVVGIDGIVHRVEQLGAFLTQIVAMAVEVIAIAEVLAVASSRARAPLRAVAIGAGALVILVTLSATVRPVADATALLVGAIAACAALAGAVSARKAPFVRAASRVVGAAAAAALVRVGALALALEGPRFATAARVASTASLALEALAIVLAMTAAARGGLPVPTSDGAPPPARRGLVDPLVVIALALALFGVRAVLVDPGDAGPVGALLRRAVEVLSPRPRAFGPPALGAFVALLAPLLGAVGLARRRSIPALSGAAALALLAASSPEMPFASISLLVAGFALVLVGGDPRALWAALSTAKPAATVDATGPVH